MHIIVVGVGGVGAMASWRLAAAGHQVTALEQFHIDHDRGSSYGDSRIVRRVYPSAFYTGLMAQAYDLWDALMAETGDSGLFVRAGGIFLGPERNPDVTEAEFALHDSGVAFERLDARECMRRFPAFHVDVSEVALFEPGMGYARASHAVRAAAALAVRYGACIRQGTPVAAIEPSVSGVRVRLESGECIDGDHVVITAGPWTAPLLEPLGVMLPLTVTRQAYVHLIPEADGDRFLPGAFPVWIDAAANTYGFPCLGEVPGVKIGLHDFGAPSAPEAVERAVLESDRESARSYARRRFPKLSGRVAYEKVCLYSVTPDNDFIIDSVPGLPQSTFISACSGHGFKFTPLMGQIAADRVDGRTGPYDLSPFRLSRFRGND